MTQKKQSFVFISLFAIVLYILFSVKKHYKKSKRRTTWKTMSAECTTGGSMATIFMILLCRGHKETAYTVDTLISLFDQSACPMHLSVGIYEVVEDLRASSAVARRYSELCLGASTRLGRNFSDRFKIIKVPVQRAKIPDIARGFVLQQAYNGEAFVGTVASGVVLSLGWDRALLDARRRAANPLACMTSPPCVHVGSNIRMARHDWSDLFLESFDKRISAPSRVSTFLHIAESTKGTWPRIGARQFAHKDLSVVAPDVVVPQPSLFWCGELSLAPAAAFVETGNFKNALVNACPFGAGPSNITSLRDTDYSTSLGLWTAGWDFYTPTIPIARWRSHEALKFYESSNPSSKRYIDHGWLGNASKRNNRRSVSEFAAFTSTDPYSGESYARSALGVTPQQHVREITAKYGSLREFEAEKEALMMDLLYVKTPPSLQK